MKILEAFPPNYHKIVEAFPFVATVDTLIFTYGDTMYVPNGGKVPPEKFRHDAFRYIFPLYMNLRQNLARGEKAAHHKSHFGQSHRASHAEQTESKVQQDHNGHSFGNREDVGKKYGLAFIRLSM